MKKLAHLLTLALLVNFTFLTQPSVFAQNRNPVSSDTNATGQYAKQIQVFEEFARKQMALDKTVGLTIGFLKDDFVWVNGYGYADLENKTPAKPESAYRLASVTKPMTALAILQLVEKGKINLDAED